MTAGDERWEIWVDTGGTFTDCVARSPLGGVERAKVLSSSALRGEVESRVDARTLVIRGACVRYGDLLRDFRFRALDRGEGEAEVLELDPETGMLRLDRDVAELPPHAVFELVSDEEAPILAARLVTGTPAGEALPAMRMRVATTRGTNALLERRGADVALFVTAGFRDLLAIGTQQRPDLFALRIDRPDPLPGWVVEVPERIASDGAVLRGLDEEAVQREARRLSGLGVRVAAVALVNSYRNAVHEGRVREILRDAGFEHVTSSAAISRSIHLLDRAQTASVNAYLAPVLERYLSRVDAALAGSGEGGLRAMTSAGGLMSPRDYRPMDSLLSGPAAGIVGAAAAGRAAGFSRILTFDMGGTSTDVARFDGAFDYSWKHEVAGVQLLAPALAIESVAAGGGSICDFVGGGLTVGPESAGAIPGPACYGGGGPLTVTDCNFLLGRLAASAFGLPLIEAASVRALDALRERIFRGAGERPEREPLLHGLIEIANERMADAIRAVSIRRGYDPAEYALLAFGGAGGQHACGIAERLGIRTIVVPPDPALLSARGLAAARIERIAERQVLRAVGPDATWLDSLVASVTEEATQALALEISPGDGIEIARQVANVRLLGQESTIAIEFETARDLGVAFAARYHAIYGFAPAERELEIESIRVIARAASASPSIQAPPLEAAYRPSEPTRLWVDGGWRQVTAIPRYSLSPQATVGGPALVADPHSTIFVAPGWSAAARHDGTLILTHLRADRRDTARGRAPEAVREELFTSRFEALVGEMGDQLRRTALSVNVKERLDFSCALLDADGVLVANAPHIPVHLGALGLCVRSVAASLDLEPGDVVVTNHPAFGGSHLPDITVISPVHAGDGELVGYVANRAHHAEIGGSRPGSMPPDATTLEEEGVVLPPTRVIHRGGASWTEIERALRDARYPSRTPDDNLADLRAQAAANHRGAQLLSSLAARHGTRSVRHYMKALVTRSERLARAALGRLPRSDHAATETLDDGSRLCVAITVRDGSARIDFAGTAPVHPRNLNATPAVVRSAVLYVLRLLVDEPIPLNEGLLLPVDIAIPESLLAPPFGRGEGGGPAVVGGNTEVSQRLVDTLLKALGLSACSQGTMNNLLWGTDRFAYYETIGGGAGAGEGFPGASGVHTHMTNTRITDIEVLEHRYPVRVARFELRGASGGTGRWRGGDGLRREIEFLEAMEVSLLCQHRREGPYGAKGGDPGLPGRQWIVRASGAETVLEGIDGCAVERGDRLVIETPGGGGWGE